MKKSLKVLLVGSLIGLVSSGIILMFSNFKSIAKEREIKNKELEELERLKQKYEK